MLKAKIQADQIAAMKSGEKEKLETLRFVLAQIKNKEIEKREDLTDEEVVSILKKQSKQLQESIDAFEKGNRTDLATQYKGQKEIVDSYLPEELSDEALTAAVDEIIAKNQETYNANPKALIGICMKELRSKADPSRIMAILNARG